MLVFPKYAKSANLSRRIADVLTISCCRELANFPPEFHVPFVANLIDENVEYWSVCSAHDGRPIAGVCSITGYLLEAAIHLMSFFLL